MKLIEREFEKEGKDNQTSKTEVLQMPSAIEVNQFQGDFEFILDNCIF